MSDDQDDFFIGYSAGVPDRDRRFLLGTGLGLTAAAAALGVGLAAFQRPAGASAWNLDEREWRGRLFTDPFPVLRTRDIDGTERSAWLVCAGKCGVARRVATLTGMPVRVKASLISRGDMHLLSASEDLDWIEQAGDEAGSGMDWPGFREYGPISLAGEIFDAKCLGGAMRPANGKVHKACASLCIRGGIPPGLFLRHRFGREYMLLLVDEYGTAHGPELLPLVADPVTVQGRLLQRADTLFLAAPLEGIERRRA